METGQSEGAFLPLGDFLTADEPVWVWDATARRILWANQAGRVFWGANSLDALQSKRFSPRNKSVERLNRLAAQSSKSKETVEVLTLNGASGRTSFKWYVQGLQVAGGKPGLIVKAVDAPANEPGSQPARGPGGVTRKSVTKKRGGRYGEQNSDRTALNAIAARLKSTSKPLSDRDGGQISASQDVSMDMIALRVRELSHELRNPLTVILGFADRIKNAIPPGDKHNRLREYADDICEGANLAISILSDFSARILQPDNKPDHSENADIKKTVESCLRLITPLAQSSGIKLYRRIDGRLPALAIPSQTLKQILLNLLMNAVRHHKTGGQVKVTASLRKSGAIRLAVMDDGVGMSKKEIKKLFSKVQRPAGPARGRSGLGLQLVKRLVEEAGATLAIQSARGKGTTVEIVFPAPARKT